MLRSNLTYYNFRETYEVEAPVVREVSSSSLGKKTHYKP